MLRSMTAESVHRRKSSPPKKRPVSGFSSRRANTRISRRIIEEDLQLLRQVEMEPALATTAEGDALGLSGDRD